MARCIETAAIATLIVTFHALGWLVLATMIRQMIGAAGQ